MEFFSSKGSRSRSDIHDLTVDSFEIQPKEHSHQKNLTVLIHFSLQFHNAMTVEAIYHCVPSDYVMAGLRGHSKQNLIMARPKKNLDTSVAFLTPPLLVM